MAKNKVHYAWVICFACALAFFCTCGFYAFSISMISVSLVAWVDDWADRKEISPWIVKEDAP